MKKLSPCAKAMRENVEMIQARHNEVIDTGQSLIRRDLFIIEMALAENLKKISRLASKERQHFGVGNFSELEDYMEHLQRKINAMIDPEMIVTTQEVKL